MMRCEEFLAEVSELIDREMEEGIEISGDASWYQALRTHAQQCRDCFVIYETTKQTIRLVGDGSLFELPVEVSERLHAALDRRIGEELRSAAGPRPDAQPYVPGKSGEAAGTVLNLPWSPAEPPRRWWRSGGMAIAAAALLLAAIVGLQRVGRQTVYVAGWLSDVHCSAAYRRHPELHPRMCMLAGWCQQSGFGVIDAHGHFTPFDQGVTHQVVTLLEANSSPDHIWVQADGRERNGVLQVKDIELRTPDQRLAGTPGPSLLRDMSTAMAPVGWH